MADFRYQELFTHASPGDTRFRKLAADGVATTTFEGREVVRVAPEALTRLAREAFREIAFFYRPRHLAQVAAILDDPEASENDRSVAVTLLRNAVVSAQGKLPMCQDTGTATIVGKKGERVWTGGGDAEALARGVFETYTTRTCATRRPCRSRCTRRRTRAPTCRRRSTSTPPTATPTNSSSSPREAARPTSRCSSRRRRRCSTRRASRSSWRERLRSLGTAACPPYHLVFVIGGTSAETTMKTVKLASAGSLDDLPETGDDHGRAFRDRALEAKVLELARQSGIGAQFGGKYFALDARVIRLPRHGASCPVGMGVSCSADRNILGRIDRDGVWLEELEHEPIRFLPERYRGQAHHEGVPIDLNRPMPEILAEISRHPVATLLLLSGPIVVARDIAHARLKERLDRGEDLPDYFKRHPVYYAGPAKTPAGMPSGSFGPTTAGRMDSYVELFQSRGGSMVMIAKGNRSKQVTDACAKHGGFYLGSIGGPAALLAQEAIRKVELLEYPELGMEAIYRIEVEDFPAFILVDDKGNDFFQQLSLRVVA